MVKSRPFRAGQPSVSPRLLGRLEALLSRERDLWAEGLERVAGVDEAGVGPLAGPVVAAAVVFAPGSGIPGVDDSKRLAPARREVLAVEIRRSALAYAVAVVDPGEIDRLNIYRATLLAMQRAVLALPVRPDRVLVDARRIPGIDLPQEAIVHGDASCHAVAAASILAKVARDAIMASYDAMFPGYGFALHKGYPTEAHRHAIRRLGPCAIHRRSFTLLPPRGLWDETGGGEVVP
jgi:ribonuclease HII